MLSRRLFISESILRSTLVELHGTMNTKVCTIVGFGGGVSTGVAKVFAREGYALALVARNPAKLAQHAHSLQSGGAVVKTFAGDAGNAASLIQAFSDIRSSLGDTEVLIYNAAAVTPGQPTTLTEAQLVADFRVNVTGAIIAVQQVVPAMRLRGKGTILLTGGGFAIYPLADLASLSIGKAGIRNLADSLSQELSPAGIHVGTVTICGTVAPGTHFDPDQIALSYLALHQQTRDAWQTELIYQ